MAECVFVSFFRALFGSACLALSVTGCGGGGGAGGASPIVTMPDQTAPLPVAITPSALEINNTPALSMVAADRAYDLGLSGSTLSIGVVDSGVDASHSELAGRVIGGGDWHSDGNGTSDPYGHGTHVASIIAGASNGTGTQGITSLTEIVSYRILNNTGSFGGISGNLMVPGKSNKEIARSYGLSEVTVKLHLKSLRVKLGAKNRIYAVCRVIEFGLATEN